MAWLQDAPSDTHNDVALTAPTQNGYKTSWPFFRSEGVRARLLIAQGDREGGITFLDQTISLLRTSVDD
jgi:hypothetical protein